MDRKCCWNVANFIKKGFKNIRQNYFPFKYFRNIILWMKITLKINVARLCSLFPKKREINFPILKYNNKFKLILGVTTWIFFFKYKNCPIILFYKIKFFKLVKCTSFWSKGKQWFQVQFPKRTRFRVFSLCLPLKHVQQASVSQARLFLMAR